MINSFVDDALPTFAPGRLYLDAIKKSRLAWWRAVLVKVGLKRFGRYRVEFCFVFVPDAVVMAVD